MPRKTISRCICDISTSMKPMPIALKYVRRRHRRQRHPSREADKGNGDIVAQAHKSHQEEQQRHVDRRVVVGQRHGGRLKNSPKRDV